MCLATAYVKKNEEENILAKNISKIDIDGGRVVMTDILGAEFVVPGQLVRADLVEGIVVIAADVQPA